MSIAGHFRSWRLVYRLLSGFFAFGFLMRYLWAPHLVWSLCAVAIFFLGAVVPQAAFVPAQIAFSLLVLPTLVTFVQRASYLWEVPNPHGADIMFESLFTAAMLWVLIAVGFLTFRPVQVQKHVI